MSATSSNAAYWPWGNVPTPESVHQQKITSQLFRGDTFPPAILPTAPITTSYCRLSGLGPPPSDIGRPGDIYLDKSPKSFALYGRDQMEWSIWPGPQSLFKHPTIHDRCLWCSVERIAWYPGKYVVDDARMRSRQSASDMIREALRNESKGCASGVTGTEAYRENRRRRRRSEKEVENGGGKRPSSDLTASDDSERVKRLKVRHENASAGEVSYREEGEETEESDHLEYLLEDDYSEELQWHNIQNERANDEQPGWWRDAVAQLCKRCPEVDAQVSML